MSKWMYMATDAPKSWNARVERYNSLVRFRGVWGSEKQATEAMADGLVTDAVKRCWRVEGERDAPQVEASQRNNKEAQLKSARAHAGTGSARRANAPRRTSICLAQCM